MCLAFKRLKDNEAFGPSNIAQGGAGAGAGGVAKTGLGHRPNMLQVTNELQFCGKPVGRLKLIIGIRVRTYVAHEAATGLVVNHIMWVMGLKILLLPSLPTHRLYFYSVLNDNAAYAQCK